MANILVVDDERSIRNTFKSFLEQEGHEVTIAENVHLAMEAMDAKKPDLVITDIIMPRTSGVDFLKTVKERDESVQAIVMTGEPTVETAREAVAFGAHDYLIKPVRKDTLLIPVRNGLQKKRLHDENLQLEIENRTYREGLERMVSMRTDQLQKAVFGTIRAIDHVFESKDPYTAGHQRRVAYLSYAIAKKLEMNEERMKRVFYAAYLHDIGKIMISSEILAKPGQLSPGEFAVIREHVERGYELTCDIALPWPVADIILQHHERLDGSGYPKGLKEAEIQLEARILAVADVIEAMTSHRPYRPGFPLTEALDEIRKNRGSLYDEGVVDAALALFETEDYDFSEMDFPSTL